MLRTTELILLKQLCLARKRANRAFANNVSRDLSQLPVPIVDSKVVEICSQHTVKPCTYFCLLRFLFFLVDNIPGGFLFYFWLLLSAPMWIYSQIAGAIDVSKLVLLCLFFQERKLVSTALLLQWTTDTALVRKFVTWIGQECHRLSQKRTWRFRCHSN